MLIFNNQAIGQQDIFEKFAAAPSLDGDAVTIKNGVMSMANLQHEMSLFVINRSLTKQNGFKIYTRLTFVSGQSTTGYGLVWNSNGWQNCNVFLISANGYYCVGFYKNGVYFQLRKWTKCTFINTGKAQNTLGIEQNGIKTDFIINGNKIFSAKSRKSDGNGHGFAIRKGLTIETNAFDIKTYNAHINTTNDFAFIEKNNAGSEINSPTSEIAPTLGFEKLYFGRIHHYKNTGDENDCDIWVANQNNDNNFSKAENIGFPLNNTGTNVVIKECDNGKTLYIEGIYHSDGKFKSDNGISKSTLVNGKWTSPQEIKINNFYNRNIHATYSLSKDLKVLVMSIERDDGFGGLDLHVSFLQSDGSYSTPQNLGAIINTFADDGTPFIDYDNKTLFFSSYGHNGYGSSDIFVTYRLDNTWLKWSEPQNLGPIVNTPNWDSYFSTSPDGSTAFMVSNNPITASEDIYKLSFSKNKIQPTNAIVEGKILNSRTLTPIAAEVFYEDKSTKNSLKSISLMTLENPGSSDLVKTVRLFLESASMISTLAFSISCSSASVIYI